MKSSIFQDAMESSTKVFGRKNVSVVFQGEDARTTADTVVLPSLPHSAEINIDQANVIRGYRDHESMHVRITDTSPATMAKMQAIENTGNKHLMQITQFCEDIRIENAGITEYPGMKVGLTATNTEAAKLLMQQIESYGKAEDVVPSLPRPLQFRLMLQSLARKEIGVESGGVYDAITQHIKAKDQGLYDLAETWAKKMVELPTGFKDGILDEQTSRKGTAASLALADQIFKAFEDYSEVTPPPPPNDDGEGDNGGGQGQSQGQGGGGGGDQEGEGQGQGQGQGQGDGDGQGQGGGSSAQGQGQGQGGGQGGGKSGSKNSSTGKGNDTSSGGQDEAQGGGGQQPQQSASSGGTTGNKGGLKGGDGTGNFDAAPPPQKPAPDIDDSDLMKKALEKTVNEITSSGVKTVRGKSKGRYAQWRNDLAVRVPIIDVMMNYAGLDKSDKPAEGLSYLQSTGRDYINRIELSVTGKRAMIRRILELELQARSDRRWESGKKTGRLHSVRVVDAMHGREAVYQRRSDGKDMDTILFISIDGSSSMSGAKSFESAALAYALSEAIERTGCEIVVSIWGDKPYTGKGAKFNNKQLRDIQHEYHNEIMLRNKARQANPLTAPPPKYVALGQIVRAIVKDKKQRTTDPNVKIAFGLAADALPCGTPSYPAIFADLKELAKEQYAKKIYLHITDGEANHPSEDVKQADIMNDAYNYAESIGVHMIGVGIGGHSVRHMFRESINVTGADAYEPVIKKLAKIISKEAGHATVRSIAA